MTRKKLDGQRSNGNHDRPGTNELLERRFFLLSHKGDDDATKAKDLLLARRKELGIEYLTEKDFSLDHRRNLDSSVIRMMQTYHGIPVQNGEIVMECRDGVITYLRISTRDPKIRKYPPGTGQLTPSEAENIALSSLNDKKGRGRIEATKKTFVRIGDEDVLAFSVILHGEDPIEGWNVLIEAATGKVLQKIDMIRPLNVKGRLISPNPVVKAKNSDLRCICGGYNQYTLQYCKPPEGFSSSADFEVLKEKVLIRDVEKAQSGADFLLQGPYVKILIWDTQSQSWKTAQYCVQNARLDFPIYDNAGGVDYECVMVYYHIDLFQRYVQSVLGYTDLCNRQLQARIDCCPDPTKQYMACYDPSSKALVFYRTYWSCWNDAAEDAEVILHEYVHAIMGHIVDHTTICKQSEFNAIEEGVASFIPCAFFAESYPFHYSTWADWMYSDNLPPADWLEDMAYPYPDWLDRRPMPNAADTDWRSWSYDGMRLFTYFLMKTYNSACGGNPTGQCTKDFLSAVLRTMELIGVRASLEEASECFARSIMYYGVSLLALQDMLNVLKDKKIMRFNLATLTIGQPRIGDWREASSILADMTLGPQSSQQTCILTELQGSDLWIGLTPPDLILSVRMANRPPHLGGTARLFIVQIDFDTLDASNNAVRVKLDRPIRSLQSNLPRYKKRVVSFKIPPQVFEEMGNDKFRVIVTIVTPDAQQVVITDWHEGVQVVLSSLPFN
jgi:hypothetical protein